MFVGHALLAFALVAAAAHLAGWRDERALRVGVLAALFATLPDVDILYAPVGLIGGISGLSTAVAAFWETGNVVHRGPTHSLLVGAVAAGAFALWHRGSTTDRCLGSLALAGLVGLTAVVSGLLGGLVVAAFALAGVVVVHAVRDWEVAPATVGVVALAGLFTHPVGDLFTGSPPSLLYPLDAAVVGKRVVLHPDPTLHLLGAFGVELLTAWAAVLVALRLTDRSLAAHVDRRAVLGVGYAGAVLAVPPPTLEASYRFVFGVLSLGVVGVPTRRVWPVDWWRVGCTALATVTCAGLAYAGAYLAV